MCEYAVKLTCKPGRIEERDVQKLRDAGLSDEQVTIAAQVISYFNYINRIADGLGVDLEDWMPPDHAAWLDRKGSDYLQSITSGGD